MMNHPWTNSSHFCLYCTTATRSSCLVHLPSLDHCSPHVSSSVAMQGDRHQPRHRRRRQTGSSGNPEGISSPSGSHPCHVWPADGPPAGRGEGEGWRQGAGVGEEEEWEVIWCTTSSRTCLILWTGQELCVLIIYFAVWRFIGASIQISVFRSVQYHSLDIYAIFDLEKLLGKSFLEFSALDDFRLHFGM